MFWFLCVTKNLNAVRWNFYLFYFILFFHVKLCKEWKKKKLSCKVNKWRFYSKVIGCGTNRIFRFCVIYTEQCSLKTQLNWAINYNSSSVNNNDGFKNDFSLRRKKLCQFISFFWWINTLNLNNTFRYKCEAI